MSDTDRIAPGISGQAPQLRAVCAPQWSGLSDAGNDVAYCSAWLSLQCTRIPGVTAGLLAIRQPDTGLPVISAIWPGRHLDVQDLSRLAERAYIERRAVVSPGRVGPDASPAPLAGILVAAPLGVGSEPIAVAAVALATSRAASISIAPERVADQLRWGAGWLEALPWARRSKELSYDTAQAKSCLDLLVAIGEQPRLQAMAITVVNVLASQLHCDRVSIGTVRRNGAIRLLAISHSATFKNQGRLIDAIENAMEETVDQRSAVSYPVLPSTERAVTMAHQALADIVKLPGSSLLSVPLVDSKGELIGAITLERHGERPFQKATLQLSMAIAAFLEPIVGLQLRANRLLAGRIVDRAGDGFTALFGPRRPSLKLGTIGIIGLALVLLLGNGEHRVTAQAVLEAELLRAAVAPFAGFIRAAPVRAGNTVKRGDLMAALDDRDLILDRQKLGAERDVLVWKQRDALAKHDRTSLVILDFQIRQVEAQLSLANEKVSRARIVAPFDGIIVSGDLSQMIGSPVETGQVLFEIAPLDSYRLAVQVDEHDFQHVSVEQRGIVVLAGMPWDPLPLAVNKITPISVAQDGRNYFRIEARLTGFRPNLRPGMEGVARIETGQRSLLWIWTHAVIDAMRLVAWKYLP